MLVVLVVVFLLGTNFRIQIEFAPSSGLRRAIDWALDVFWEVWAQEEPVPPSAPEPKPVAPPAPSPIAPAPVTPKPVAPPRPSTLGWTPKQASVGAPPVGSRPSTLTGTPPRSSVAFGGSGHPTRPLPEGGEKRAVWSPRDSQWYPPGTMVNQMGGAVYPVAPHQRPLKEWDFAKANWSSPSDGESQNSFAPKPFSGNLFPKKEEKPTGVAIRYTGGDYDEYDDEDELIEDDDE